MLYKKQESYDNRNTAVKNGICNGTPGNTCITEIKKEKWKETYIISVLTKDNKNLMLQI